MNWAGALVSCPFFCLILGDIRIIGSVDNFGTKAASPQIYIKRHHLFSLFLVVTNGNGINLTPNCPQKSLFLNFFDKRGCC